MRTGLYARPSSAMRAHIARWRGPEPFYFDRELITAPVSRELRDEADAICAGKRCVLGLGWIELPEDGWHFEPSANGFWPRVDAGRVVASAPRHFDPRLTWEMNRGHEWVVLARCHAATGDLPFLEQLIKELASWRSANPVGTGINWTSAMEAAIRIHSLVWCAGFLRETPAVLPTLADMIYEHTIFVADHRSYFSSANNHLIVELSALIVAGLTVGGELAGLYAPALARLHVELGRQVFPDGVNAEMATHYHLFVLEALLLVAFLQRAHSTVSVELRTVIQRMADYVAAIRCDDGTLLQQGDNDDGCILGLLRTRHADQLLASVATLRPSPMREREQMLATPFEGAFWISGGAGAPPIERPPPRSRHFVHSDQIVLRSRRLLATLDAGPFGFGSLAAHAHCDALSISIAVDGRRLVVDRGTYRYNGDLRERDRFRLTAAHNTAQIGSLEQASPAGAFLWSRQPRCTVHRCDLTDRGDIVQATHDGFPGWSHRRTLLHRDGVLAIIDELDGDGLVDRITSRYHFAPELDIATISSSVFRATLGEQPLACLVSTATSTRVIESPHSDTYGASTRAPTVELSATSECPLVIVIAPADVPLVESIEQLVELASAHGVRLLVS